jgi:antitoxin component YwqK of YwqJK toxin-antitoxin module
MWMTATGAALLVAIACSAPASQRVASAERAGSDVRAPRLPPELEPPPSLPCPDGAERVRAPLPARAVYCQRPDGTRHGPFAELFPDGSAEVLGRYDSGVLDGKWVRVRRDRRIAEEGTYRAGAKDGAWRQYDVDGGLLGEYAMERGTGVEKRWWEHGALQSATTWQGGKRQGPTQSWAPDGALIIQEMWRDGLLDGPREIGTRSSMFVAEERQRGVRVGARELWRRGYQALAEQYDSDGHLDGQFAAWRSRGRLREQGSYRHGLRHGVWTWFDRGGGKEREGSYVDGLRDGTWTSWHGRSVASVGTYRAGIPDGDFVEYDDRGRELGRYRVVKGKGAARTFHGNRRLATETQLEDGVPHGRFVAYDLRGKRISEGRFDHGARHGVWRERWPTGKVRIEARYDHGDLQGPWKRFSPKGKLEIETSYDAGKRQGPYAEYFADGTREIAGAFVDDRADGEWTQWHRGGAVAVRATWRAGALDGPWQELAPDGSVAVRGAHERGHRAGAWEYLAPDGSVQRTVTYTAP